MTKLNTTAGQVQAAQGAGKVHDWPSTAGDCTPEDWEIYKQNQQFRAHDDWVQGDLIELARVSKLQAMVAEELDKYRSEGVLVLGGKTGRAWVENPRGRAISTLNGTITQMLRRLGITVMSTGTKEGRAERARKQRELEAQTPPKKPTHAATKPASRGLI